MVKFHQTNQTYAYPLPAVSLAYFLRYPNPYSTHVLSTDVISRSFDPLTQRLHTTRLHLKRSKLPPAILKILPKGILGAGAGGEGKSFVLEKSTVDVKQGWMETESQNLEWTGVLSVIERAKYTRAGTQTSPGVENAALEMGKDDQTDVTTTVTFKSRFGQALRNSRLKGEKGVSSVSRSEEEKKGFFSSWSTTSLQWTIEGLGVQRARDSLVKSSHGMNVVLERWRNGGLGGMLEGMRRDRELVIRAGKET